MKYSDEVYFTDPFEAFKIFHTLKLSFKNGKLFNVPRNRLITAWNNLQQGQKLFEVLMRQFPTEQRMATLVAANLVINNNCHYTDLDIEYYNRLRKFNLSNYHFKSELKDLLTSNSLGELFNSEAKIIPLVTMGVISPELFSCLYTALDLDEQLNQSKQKLLWELICGRFKVYADFVTLNSNVRELRALLTTELQNI